MAVYVDGNSDKRRILNELSRCLKTVYLDASGSNNSSVYLALDCPLIQCVDRALQHGLLNLLHSYWPLVRNCSHAQTLETIDNWAGSECSHRLKGKAWLLATLVEGSFLSYFQCILSESQCIERYYAPHAMLRDASSLSQLSSLLTGIESVNFLTKEAPNSHHESYVFSVEENASAIVKPALDLSLNGAQGLQAMTSSMTSSLASPGDSGFTQLDSETDTASFSEILLEADSTSVKEDIAVLPVDPCTEKTIGCSGAFESININQETNSNTLSRFTDVYNSAVHEVPSDIDEIVYRRPKDKADKTTNVKQQKRVSFHECTPDSTADDTILHDNFILKETERLSNSFKASASNLSRAVGEFSSFDCEQEGVEIANDSSILGNDGIEELSSNKADHVPRSMESPLNSVKFVVLRHTSQKNGKEAPVAERGIPEGQEDPPQRCSVLATVNTDLTTTSTFEQRRISCSSSSALSCSSLKAQVSTPRRLHSDPNTSSAAIVLSPCASSVLSQTPSKACLVNRFLRSITEKKIYNRRTAAALAALNKNTSSARKLNLFISGVKPVDSLSQELVHELDSEIGDFFAKSTLNGASVDHPEAKFTTHQIHAELKLAASEKVLKMLRVRGTASPRTSLLAVITDQALHVVDKKKMIHSILDLSDLSSILVGPNSQWLSLKCEEKSSQVDLLMGGSDDVSQFVSAIEIELRRKGKKVKCLPGVTYLHEEVFMVPQWMSVLQSEKVCNYLVVHALEETLSPPCSPSGPDLRAHFMFRMHGNGSWQPGYFVLKAGVLHVSPDEEQPPLHSLSLKGVKCSSVALPSRPHIIQVGSLHIAAPDNNVALDWLAAIHKSSSGLCEVDGTDQKLNITCGSLVLTEKHLMLLNSFGIPNGDLNKLPKPVLSAFVSDIISLQVGSPHSCWCIVEFSCREVYESSGDYMFFFSNGDNKLSFMESLWKLNPTTKQNTRRLCESDAFFRHCENIEANLARDS